MYIENIKDFANEFADAEIMFTAYDNYFKEQLFFGKIIGYYVNNLFVIVEWKNPLVGVCSLERLILANNKGVLLTSKRKLQAEAVYANFISASQIIEFTKPNFEKQLVHLRDIYSKYK